MSDEIKQNLAAELEQLKALIDSAQFGDAFQSTQRLQSLLMLSLNAVLNRVREGIRDLHEMVGGR